MKSYPIEEWFECVKDRLRENGFSERYITELEDRLRQPDDDDEYEDDADWELDYIDPYGDLGGEHREGLMA